MAKADSAAKTEKPTPKKIKEGVKQGQVARTTDLAAWTGLLALTLLLPVHARTIDRATPSLTSHAS